MAVKASKDLVLGTYGQHMHACVRGVVGLSWQARSRPGGGGVVGGVGVDHSFPSTTASHRPHTPMTDTTPTNIQGCA